MVEGQLADALVGVEIVSAQGRPMRSQVLGMLGDSRLGGVALVVLFLMVAGQGGVLGGRVVLGLDELGHEEQNTAVALGDS